MNPYIITRHGYEINYLRPKADQIDLRDICHALSRICRFNGHTQTPYYVAQHVCLATDYAPGDCKREAFMHDASEAFTGDCPAPLKSLLSAFTEIESRLERVLARKFRYRYPYPTPVREVDMRLLVTEIRDLTKRRDWQDYPFTPFDERIVPWSTERCEREFRVRVRTLQLLITR